MIFDGSIDQQQQLEQLAQDFSTVLRPGAVIYTEGELGAGKTTFIRAVLRSFGVSGRIKSPSYTLIETYETGDMSIYHMDFYRCTSLSDIVDLGLDDYFTKDSMVFIEWPEKAQGQLPEADFLLSIKPLFDSDSRWVKLVSCGKI